MLAKTQAARPNKKNNQGYLSAFCISGLLSYLNTQGAAGQAAIDEANIVEVLPEDKARTMPYSIYRNLCNAAEKHLQDPLVNFRGVKKSRIEDWGIAFYAVVSQPTMVDMMDRYRDLANISTSMVELNIIPQSDGVVMRLEATEKDFDDYPRLFEMLIGIFNCTAERGLNKSRLPLEIRLEHSPRGSAEEYEKAIGVPVVFNQPHTEIFIPSSIVEAPTVRPDQDLSELMTQQMHDQFLVPVYNEEFDRSVIALLERAKDPEDWKLEGISKKLGVSPRTLQNKLGLRGTTFKALVENVRKEKAELMLRSPKTVTDIAYQMGFSDASGFSQAFSRWYGKSPNDWRNDLENG